jgi:hypothetical protein
MDLPLRPALYWPYTTAVSLRRSLRHRQRRRFEAQRQRQPSEEPSAAAT